MSKRILSLLVVPSVLSAGVWAAIHYKISALSYLQQTTSYSSNATGATGDAWVMAIQRVKENRTDPADQSRFLLSFGTTAIGIGFLLLRLRRLRSTVFPLVRTLWILQR